jgi:dihydroflavonol-4-reductase
MILVTGATGFVGSALVRQLLEAGETVRILRRETSSLDLLADAAPHVEHAVGDVTDIGAVQEAMAGVRTVVHVAAVIAFSRRAIPGMRRVNVQGTATVVNAALAEGVERFVHTSSIAALGRTLHPTGVIDEATVWTPSPANSAYAVSKRDADLEVLRGIAEGLDAVSVCPALVFGPGRSGEGTVAIAERVAAGRFPVAPAGGTAVVDVEDVATGLRLAAAHGATGERYVLAAENRLWSDLLTTLATAMGRTPPGRTAPSWLLRLGGAVSEAAAAVTRSEPTLTRTTARNASATYRYDGSKATRDLGLQYTPFEETAARLAASIP